MVISKLNEISKLYHIYIYKDVCVCVRARVCVYVLA
jgi:hypothetical protein